MLSRKLDQVFAILLLIFFSSLGLVLSDITTYVPTLTKFSIAMRALVGLVSYFILFSYSLQPLQHYIVM